MSNDTTEDQNTESTTEKQKYDKPALRLINADKIAGGPFTTGGEATNGPS